MSPRSKVIAAVVMLAAPACKGAGSGGEGTPDATATPSPQASAMPAPLANTPTSTASAVVTASLEGGPPPVPLRGDVALEADSLARETVGYTLSAVMRQGDLSGPTRAPEVNVAGIDAARKKTELRLAIELGASRMRVALLGAGWVVPAETELRARADRYGHVVVWPGGATYRPVAPGALRALIGERRFDVAPVTPAELTPKEDVGKRIGIRTRKVEVATRAAKATFEIGRAADLGEGGVLLCRMLLDLMNAPPSSALCGDGELPMRAELRWTARGSIVFEVTGMLKRDKVDLPTSSLLVPPSGATFAESPLPVAGVQAALSPPELAAFRTTPIEMPAVPHGNGDGLVVANASDQLRVLHVDGVPVAWAAPGAKDVLSGLQRGRYIVQSRTFLGEAFDPPVTQTVPGLAQLGTSDAGVR
ncbi:MAG: hypothetical protein JWP87_687 [Labilithrix sp.]|nr:hypothetical protein [Labilithrix sp.]